MGIFKVKGELIFILKYMGTGDNLDPRQRDVDWRASETTNDQEKKLEDRNQAEYDVQNSIVGLQDFLHGLEETLTAENTDNGIFDKKRLEEIVDGLKERIATLKTRLEFYNTNFGGTLKQTFEELADVERYPERFVAYFDRTVEAGYDSQQSAEYLRKSLEAFAKGPVVNLNTVFNVEK